MIPKRIYNKMKKYEEIQQRKDPSDTKWGWREKKLWLAITACLKKLTPVPNEGAAWGFTDKPEGVKLTEEMYLDPEHGKCWFRVDEKLTGGNPREAWVGYLYYPVSREQTENGAEDFGVVLDEKPGNKERKVKQVAEAVACFLLGMLTAYIIKRILQL